MNLFVIFLFGVILQVVPTNGQCPSVQGSIICTCYGSDDIICKGNKSINVENPVKDIVENISNSWPNTSIGVLLISIKELGTIPPDSFQNISIRNLALPDSSLKNFTNDTFSGLENSLVELDLLNNEFTEVPGGALENLNLLTILKMPMNMIKVLKTGEFAGVSQLKELDISNNQIRRIEPNTFKNMNQLDYLNLASNRLYVFNLKSFIGLRNLQVLDLTGNKLKKITRRWLKRLTNLTEIHLGNNLFKSLGDINLPGNSLKIVDLSGNKITRCFNGFNLPKIQSIDLSYNLMPGLDMNCFGNLSSLNELNLSNNHIESIESHALQHLVSLKSLNLENNHLKIIGAESLYNSFKLQNISLDDNPLELIDQKSGISLMNNLAILSIRNCLLTSFKAQILPANPAPTPTSVFLDGNPLVCTCQMYEFAEVSEQRGFTISGEYKSPSNCRGMGLVQPAAFKRCQNINETINVKMETAIATLDSNDSITVEWTVNPWLNLSHCNVFYQEESSKEVKVPIECPKSSKAKVVLIGLRPGVSNICFSLRYINLNHRKCNWVEVLEKPTTRVIKNNRTVGLILKAKLEDEMIKMRWNLRGQGLKQDYRCKLILKSGEIFEILKDSVNCENGEFGVPLDPQFQNERLSVCLEAFENSSREISKCVDLEQSKKEDQNEDNLPQYAKALIGIAVVAGALAVGAVAAAYIVKKRKNKMNKEKKESVADPNEETGLVKASGSSSEGTLKGNVFQKLNKTFSEVKGKIKTKKEVIEIQSKTDEVSEDSGDEDSGDEGSESDGVTGDSDEIRPDEELNEEEQKKRRRRRRRRRRRMKKFLEQAGNIEDLQGCHGHSHYRRSRVWTKELQSPTDVKMSKDFN